MSSWEKSMTFERRKNLGCALIDEHRVILCGGQVKDNDLSSSMLWDAEAKSLTQLPDVPVTMPFCRVVYLDGYVYALGSHRDFYRLNTLNLFEVRPVWEKMNDSAAPGVGFALVATEKHIYKIGGMLTPRQMARFDVAKNQWDRLPSMSTDRRGVDACYVNHHIYVIGGRSSKSSSGLNTTDIFDLNDMTWTKGPDLPAQIMNHSAIVVGDKIVVSGGRSKTNGPPVTATYALEWKRSNPGWKKLKHNMVQPISHHASVATDFKLYILGGVHNAESTSQNDVVYSIACATIHNEKTGGFTARQIEHEVDDDEPQKRSFFCCKQK